MDFNKIHNRLGTYCTQWDFIEDRFGEKDLLPFSISDTDFLVPKQIQDQLFKNVEHGIFGYTRWRHNDYLNAISNYFKRRFDTHIDKSWIIYSPSVMYSVSILLRQLCNEGDAVAVFNPMYDAFIDVIENNSLKINSVLLNSSAGKFVYDPEELELAISKSKVFLLCSPHNPTGRLWTNEELEEIIMLAKKYHVFVISDEIHMDVNLSSRKHQPILKYLKDYPNIALVSSVSKTMNTPALGGSYAIIPSNELYDVFQQITRKRDFVNSASIMGIEACMIGYRDCDDYIEELNLYIKQNMNLLKEHLLENIPEFTFDIPEATYLAWIDTRSSGFSMKAIQDSLIKNGKVAIMDGRTYGSGGEGYLRMNVACPKAKLIEGLNRMNMAMNCLRGGN